MSVMGEPSSTTGARVADAGDGARVSLLDQMLWKQFAEAATPEAFMQIWLALQCRIVDGAVRGVAVLGEPDAGPFRPVAFWPDPVASGSRLGAAAELCLAERRPVIEGDAAAAACVACPILLDDAVHGVVALEVERRPRGRMREVMRQLQWGLGWVEVLLRRQTLREQSEFVGRAASAFDVIAAAVEHPRFEAAAQAVALELAARLDCDLVAIGFRRRGRCRVETLSHAAQFGSRMNMVRALGAAMDEAVDQKAVIAIPQRDDWDYRVARDHGLLVQAHGMGAALTVPIHADGRFFGAITCIRPPGAAFDDDAVELCDSVAAIVGPILDEKRRNDRLVIWKLAESVRLQAVRLFGPGHAGRKAAVLALAAVVGVLSFATGEYRLTSPATLAGSVQRTLVAPIDGYVASQHARAGDTVRAGQLLASLDERELRLERLRWEARRNSKRTEFHRALSERDPVAAKVVRAEIDEAEAQMQLIDAQLARTRITAPFDGILLSGDLSQAIGAAVTRGKELFVLAPLDGYRVVLEVDEGDLADVAPGQSGVLRLSSMPETPLRYVVERVIPVAEAAEGRNYFRAEARLTEPDPSLRPGMGGFAKTLVDERLLVAIWTRRLVDWLRLTAWKWLPS